MALGCPPVYICVCSLCCVTITQPRRWFLDGEQLWFSQKTGRGREGAFVVWHQAKGVRAWCWCQARRREIIGSSHRTLTQYFRPSRRISVILINACPSVCLAMFKCVCVTAYKLFMSYVSGPATCVSTLYLGVKPAPILLTGKSWHVSVCEPLTKQIHSLGL